MKTFKVKDLMVNIAPSAGGGPLRPMYDGPIATSLTPFTPVISAAAITSQLRLAEKSVRDAMKETGDVHLTEAVALGTRGGSVMGTLLDKLDRVVVGSAVLAYGGGAMPSPDCAGTSLETIPTRYTTVVLEASSVLSRSQLPALKSQLKQVLAAVETAELELTPKGRDVAMVRGELEVAIAELGR